jgi:hypothetical protein
VLPWFALALRRQPLDGNDRRDRWWRRGRPHRHRGNHRGNHRLPPALAKNQEALKVTNAGYLQTVVSYAAASEEANAGQTDTAAAGGNTAPVLRATPLYGDLEVQPYNNVGPQFTAQYPPHYVATGYQPTPNPNH